MGPFQIQSTGIWHFKMKFAGFRQQFVFGKIAMGQKEGVHLSLGTDSNAKHATRHGPDTMITFDRLDSLTP